MVGVVGVVGGLVEDVAEDHLVLVGIRPLDLVHGREERRPLELDERLGPVGGGQFPAVPGDVELVRDRAVGHPGDVDGRGAAVLGAGLAVAFPVFPVLCLTALLTGGATGVAVISLQRHVGRAAAGALQLRQVFSWLSIGPAVSNFVGPFTAGLLIDHAGALPNSTDGYRAAFFLMAVLPLACWFLVRPTRELPPVLAAAGSASTNTWDLLREPTFRRLMLVNWFLSSCWDVHTFVVPVLGFERGISASVIGSILGAFAVAAAAIRLVMPLVAAHLREWRVLVVAKLVTSALFALAAAATWLIRCCHWWLPSAPRKPRPLPSVLM